MLQSAGLSESSPTARTMQRRSNCERKRISRCFYPKPLSDLGAQVLAITSVAVFYIGRDRFLERLLQLTRVEFFDIDFLLVELIRLRGLRVVKVLTEFGRTLPEFDQQPPY